MLTFCGCSPGTAAAQQVEDCLHALAVQPRRAGHGQQHTRLCVLLVAGERFAARQHQVHARVAHAADGADGADEFALQRARLADLLLEIGGGEALAAIEQFVADGAAGGQALLGQHDAGGGHLVGRHHDLRAAGADLIRDVMAAELVHHLAGIVQVEVAVEQGHRFGAAAQHHERQHAEHAERDRGHGGEPCRTQRLQAVQQSVHRRRVCLSCIEGRPCGATPGAWRAAAECGADDLPGC